MQPIVGEKGVKYGLSLPKRAPKPTAPVAARKPSVFGDDASDEDEVNVEQQIARQAARKQSDKQARLAVVSQAGPPLEHADDRAPRPRERR